MCSLFLVLSLNVTMTTNETHLRVYSVICSEIHFKSIPSTLCTSVTHTTSSSTMTTVLALNCEWLICYRKLIMSVVVHWSNQRRVWPNRVGVCDAPIRPWTCIKFIESCFCVMCQCSRVQDSESDTGQAEDNSLNSSWTFYWGLHRLPNHCLKSLCGRTDGQMKIDD